MSSLTEEQLSFIQSVSERNGFNNVEIQTAGGTVKGDGYMGVVRFITVKEKNDKKQLDLVLKSCHTNPELRKRMPLRKVYLREAYMYETVFPTFISFQREMNVQNPFTSVAKIYGTLTTENHEALLLQDLRSAGYKLWNRRVPMDPEHVKMVLREYGKYHATSFALKMVYPERYAKITEELTDVYEGSNLYKKEVFQNMLKGFFKRGYDALGDHPAKEELKKFENVVTELYDPNFVKEKDELVVLHGDCWSNNMMFKYEEKKESLRPTNMCFLDFQLSKLGSPVYDLAYFLYVCAPKGILLELDKYLEIYHETLSKNLQECGCYVHRIFPMKSLKSHWKKYSKYGLVCALGLLPTITSESEDIPDTSKNADNGQNNLDSFVKKTVNKSVEKRLFDLITFMSERQFL